jgi:hypothetical protein
MIEKSATATPAMLTPEKHCDILAANIRERGAAIIGWYRLFVQLASAIIGGAIVLRVQHPDGIILRPFINLSNGLLSLVSIVSIIMLADGFRAWLGHRVKYSEVAGTDQAGKLIVPRPVIWMSAITPMLMVIVMVATPILFWLFNPLGTTSAAPH